MPGIRLPAFASRFYYGWVIVATLFVVNVGIYGTGNYVLGFYILPMTADLGISRGFVGWVQTGRLVAGAVASFFIGRLIDRHGSRFLIPLAGVIAGIAVIGLGFVKAPWQFLVLFVFIGLTGLTMPGNLLTTVPVAKWFVRKRGRALAISATGLTVGSMAAPPLTQLAIGDLGWRTSWMISGAIAMVLVIPLSFVFLRREPEDLGLQPDGEEAGDRTNGGSAGELLVAEDSWTVAEALRTPALWKLCFAFIMLGFSMGGFVVNRAPYWIERGVDQGVVSLSFTVDAFMFGVFILATGALVARVAVRYLSAFGLILQGLSIGGMLLWDSVPYLFLSSCALGVSAGMNVVIQSYIWALYYGRASLGAIRGIVLPATLIGNGLGPPVIGTTYDLTGSYTLAWWLLMVLFFISAAIVSTARPPIRSNG